MMSLSDVNSCLKNNLEIRYDLPEYYPEYPVSRNSYYNAQNIKLNHNYMKEFCEIGSKYSTEINPGFVWTAFVFPFAKQKRIENMVKLASVLFCVDDNFENDFGLGGRNVEKGKLFAESICKIIDNISDIRAIPVNEMQNWKPFMFAFYVCMYKIYIKTGSTFWIHFTSSMKDYINSCINECEIEDGIYELNENKLLETFRLTNACGYPWIMLLQYAEDFALTEDELNNELTQSLITLTTQSLIMCNDLYSFHNDIRECNGVLQKSKNMIAVLMKTQLLTLQEAVDKLISITKRIDKSYAEIKRQLFETNPSENVIHLCNRIDYMLGGNWISHLTAKRYTSSYKTGIFPICGTISYIPNKTTITISADTEKKFEKFKKYILR